MSHRAELKENILASKVEIGLKWILDNRSTALTAAGVAVAVLLIGSVFVIRRREIEERSWTRLAQVQGLLSQQQFATARTVLEEIRAGAPTPATGQYVAYQLGEAALGEKKYEDAR